MRMNLIKIIKLKIISKSLQTSSFYLQGDFRYWTSKDGQLRYQFKKLRRVFKSMMTTGRCRPITSRLRGLQPIRERAWIINSKTSLSSFYSSCHFSFPFRSSYPYHSSYWPFSIFKMDGHFKVDCRNDSYFMSHKIVFLLACLLAFFSAFPPTISGSSILILPRAYSGATISPPMTGPGINGYVPVAL